MKYRPGTDYRAISGAQLDAIVVAVGYDVTNSELLGLLLDEAAEKFINDHYWLGFSSPSKLQQQLTRIGKAADKLFRRLESEDSRVADAAKRLHLTLMAAQDDFLLESVLNSGLGGTKEDRFRQLVDQIHNIDPGKPDVFKKIAKRVHTVTKRAAEQQELQFKATGDRDRNCGKKAVATLLDALITIYRTCFQRAGLTSMINGDTPNGPLVDRSINMITYHMISRSNFFQRNTTGAAFISSMPLRMRALSSWMEATRRWRRKVRAIFEKAHSIRLSQEPCLGV